MNNHSDNDYLNEFYKSFMEKHEERINAEHFCILRINLNNGTESQVEIVETSTPKKSTNELLDDYIDLVTLYELFGDECYKSKSEYVLGLLKDGN